MKGFEWQMYVEFFSFVEIFLSNNFSPCPRSASPCPCSASPSPLQKTHRDHSNNNNDNNNNNNNNNNPAIRNSSPSRIERPISCRYS